MDFIEIADANEDEGQRTRARPSVNTFDEMLRDLQKRTRWRTRTRISVNAPSRIISQRKFAEAMAHYKVSLYN